MNYELLIDELKSQAPIKVVNSDCPCDMHEFLYMGMRKWLLDNLKQYYNTHNSLPCTISLSFFSEELSPLVSGEKQ
jgi:hypothetical protein